MRRQVPLVMLILWILSTLFAVLLPQNPAVKFAATLTLAAGVIFGLSHAARRYGAGGSMAFLIIAVVVSNIFENLSISTGFPFGFYTHSAQMGPKLFLVPIVIGPGYFSLCYLAWTVANAFATGIAAPRRWHWALTMPLIASFIVTGADLCADPLGSTLAHDWTYAHGGAFYGVPFSNYLGWFLVTWVIFQTFAAYLVHFNILLRPVSKTYWYEAATFWAAMALQYPLMLTMSQGSVTVHDSSGWAWRSGDILQAATILSIYTMLAAAVTSAIVVSLQNTATHQDPRG